MLVASAECETNVNRMGYNQDVSFGGFPVPSL